MTRLASITRRSGLMLSMFVSLALAAGGLWVWIGPETVRSVSTPRLLALLGLFVLPAATAVALFYESRRSPRSHAAAAPVQPAPQAPAPPPAKAQDPVLPCDIGPPGKPAGARSHRRKAARPAVSGR